MTEQTRNAVVFLWPIILVLGSSMYQAGAYEAEMQALKKENDQLKPLIPRVAVLESQAAKMGEDLQEIKSDIKLIRDFLMRGES